MLVYSVISPSPYINCNITMLSIFCGFHNTDTCVLYLACFRKCTYHIHHSTGEIILSAKSEISMQCHCIRICIKNKNELPTYRDKEPQLNRRLFMYPKKQILSYQSCQFVKSYRHKAMSKKCLTPPTDTPLI
jgi:hypothetical protein